MNISNTDSLSSRPAICMDRRGWLHVVWEDRTPGNYDIYYTFYNGTSWADTQNVSHGSTCWRPDVATDTLNNVHVVWGDYDIGKIMWTMFDGSSWTTPVSISDEVPYSCHGPELDVSPVTNYVHCVWHDLGVVDIWHSFYDGNSWSTPENVSDDPNDSGWPDVAVDSLGRIQVVWQDCPGPSDSTEIFYSRFDSVSWTSPVNASRTVGGSVDPRIAIDMDNNPRVVWEERKNGYSVYYTYFNGTKWVNSVLVDADVSRTPNITVNKGNTAYIVWRHFNGGDNIFIVKYIDSLPGNDPQNISNTGAASARPSVEVRDSLLNIVWNDYSEGHGDIYYCEGVWSGVNEPNKPENNEFSHSFFVVSHLNISFSISKSFHVTLNIYDISGRKVKAVSLGKVNRGPHQYKIPLNIASGVYFLQVGAGNQRWWGKFTFLNP
ncbi:T9SS type A sorting domain-containing protein [candidate division WOR-3 bacterium]|nr:T9SS type A sorting domain-containing protein [candidate division WOR-3 bacterium]